MGDALVIGKYLSPRALLKYEQALKSGTAGNVDLRTLAFLGLMGLTLHQVLRGQVLGPALPMLWNAFSLIGQINRSPPAGSTGTAQDTPADAS